MNRLWIPFVFALTLGACSAETEAPPQELVRRVNVTTETLETRDFRSYLQRVGTVKAANDAVISAEVSGRLLAYPIPKGGFAAEGDVVAGIDDAKLSREVERLTAIVQLARENYERQSTLFENNIGSETELLNARYQLEQQQAALASLQVDLTNTRIRAPFSGRVEQTFAEMGELVSPGARVLRLVDSSNLKVEVGVPARYSGAVAAGDSVMLWVNRDESTRQQGVIEFVGSAVDPSSRTFPVEIRFAAPSDRLKIDMVAEVEFEILHLPGSIVVDEEFLFTSGDDMVAYVVDSNDAGEPVAREVVVETGEIYRNQVVVTSGLKPGDVFIRQGSSYLNDGTRLVIVPLEVDPVVADANPATAGL